MALGKIAIVIGSGIIGTVLTSGEAKIAPPDFRDVLAGAFKFVTKQDKKDDPSTSSPHSAHLLSQRGAPTFGQVKSSCYCYRRWPWCLWYNSCCCWGYWLSMHKGWKLSDLMFVMKRGLCDACNVVGKQLDQVSENVNAAKRHLAGRIDRIDCTLDDCQEITEPTRKEVTVIHGDISAFQEEMQSVHLVVHTLATKLGRLAYNHDRTTRGIYDLCESTKRLDKSPKADTR